jgi:hypothetical protein
VFDFHSQNAISGSYYQILNSTNESSCPYALLGYRLSSFNICDVDRFKDSVQEASVNSIVEQEMFRPNPVSLISTKPALKRSIEGLFRDFHTNRRYRAG